MSLARPGVLLAALALVAGCGRCASGPPAEGVGMGAAHRVDAPAAVDARRQAILDHLALGRGMKVAEIGLGRGWFVFRMAQAVGQAGTVYATDIDPAAVDALRAELPHIDPAAGHVDVRLCDGGRDTALDDVPAGTLDAILMVDSLCFDGSTPHEDDVAYLRRFLRLLRPGGELVHHMDCGCETTPDAVRALFTEAGFAPGTETVALPDGHGPSSSASCDTALGRRRERFAGVFRAPP